MKRLQISAVSPILPTEIVEELNKKHESLVRLLDIEFAETGFYEATKFSALELTQEFLDLNEPDLTIAEQPGDVVLRVTSAIPVSNFDTDKRWYGFEYAKEQAVQALAHVAARYELNTRALSIRAFHIRGAAQASRTRASLPKKAVETKPYHSNIPEVIPVKRYDIGHSGTQYIGKYGKGNQFWGQVVATFRKPDVMPNDVASSADEWPFRKCWYAILHKFDSSGMHLGTEHKFTGTTADGEGGVVAEAETHMKNFIDALGPVKFGNIAIRLFKVEIDGTVFGMVDTSSEEWGDTATMEPGDLVFYPPWNGEYDT